MKVMVIFGYVSHNKRLYESGDCLEVPDEAAKRLMKAGVVVEVVDHDEEKAPAEPVAEVPADDAALPDVDPTASVKPKRKAKAKK